MRRRRMTSDNDNDEGVTVRRFFYLLNQLPLINQISVLEQIHYSYYSAGTKVLMTAEVNYNYIVFYDTDDRFVMTMGLFLPSLEEDLTDRSITVVTSPVLNALLF
jgi:hypothetical protein